MIMAITNDREYRMFGFEKVENEDKPEQMLVRGKAVVFEQPTMLFRKDGIEYFEKIDRNAFEGAEMTDVVFNMNHEGPAAAKTRNQTLKLELTPDGLMFEADLSKNSTGRDIYERIGNGFLQEMSFAFTVADDVYDKDLRTRTIKKVDRLFDVSAVDNGAYSGTELSADVRSVLEARQSSFLSAEADKEFAEALEQEVELLLAELELDF